MNRRISALVFLNEYSLFFNRGIGDAPYVKFALNKFKTKFFCKRAIAHLTSGVTKDVILRLYVFFFCNIFDEVSKFLDHFCIILL